MSAWNRDEDALRSYDDLAHHGYGERDEQREQTNEQDSWMERDLPHPDEERDPDES